MYVNVLYRHAKNTFVGVVMDVNDNVAPAVLKLLAERAKTEGERIQTHLIELVFSLDWHYIYNR